MYMNAIHILIAGPREARNPNLDSDQQIAYYAYAPTQRSNAKIQRHFRSSSPRTLQEFEEKTCKTSVGKCYKNRTVRENYKLGVSVDVH